MQQALDALEYHQAQTRPIEKTANAIAAPAAQEQPALTVQDVFEDAARLVLWEHPETSDWYYDNREDLAAAIRARASAYAPAVLPAVQPLTDDIRHDKALLKGLERGLYLGSGGQLDVLEREIKQVRQEIKDAAAQPAGDVAAAPQQGHHFASAGKPIQAVQVDAPLPPDSIAVNLMRLAGLGKHKARECEEIVRAVLADRRQRAALEMEAQQPTEQTEFDDFPCSTHPDAPHGFNRNASHSAGRYVCDCEGWMPDTKNQQPQSLKADQVSASGVRTVQTALPFTDDELDAFYEEWEFAENDPGRIEFHNLVREMERRVIARVTAGAVMGEKPSIDQGWKDAAIAWEVCASIHREYAKGKDGVFKTRQADFVRHAEDARQKALAAMKEASDAAE